MHPTSSILDIYSPFPQRVLNDAIEEIKPLVVCPICLAVFSEPKALPCLHTFCRDCIDDLIHQQAQFGTVNCPACRDVVTIWENNLDTLPTISFINNLSSNYRMLINANENREVIASCENCNGTKAVAFCCDCCHICSECTEAHKKMKVLSEHKVIPLENMTGSMLKELMSKRSATYPCPQHKVPLTLFCLTCDKLACQDCITPEHGSHANHVTLEMSTATKVFKAELSSRIVPLKEVSTHIAATLEVLKKTQQSIDTQGKQALSSIEASFDQLLCMLQAHRECMLESAERLVQVELTKIRMQVEELASAQSNIESFLKRTEDAVANWTEGDILLAKKQAVNQIDELSSKCVNLKLHATEAADIVVWTPPPDAFMSLCRSTSGLVLRNATTISIPTLLAKTENIITVTITPQQYPEVQLEAEVFSMADLSLTKLTVTPASSNTPMQAFSHLTPVVPQVSTPKVSSAYNIHFNPAVRGRHQLNITSNGEKLNSSSFTLFIAIHPQHLSGPIRTFKDVVRPIGIALEPGGGSMYVAEYEPCRISVFGKEGERVAVIGGKKAPPFGGASPVCVTVDEEGNIYTATTAHKLCVLTREGGLVRSVGKEGKGHGEFRNPSDVKVHKGHVYVCDRDNDRIQVFDQKLTYVRTIGTMGTGEGQFNMPRKMAFDRQGRMFVSDGTKYRIQVFGETGEYLYQFCRGSSTEDDVNYSAGLHIEKDFLYVSEWNTHTISVFTLSGEFLAAIGQEREPLKQPWAVTTDIDGFVYVCDSGNNCIKVF